MADIDPAEVGTIFELLRRAGFSQQRILEIEKRFWNRVDDVRGRPVDARLLMDEVIEAAIHRLTPDEANRLTW